MPINWIIEAAKWRNLVKKLENIRLLRSLKAVWTGVTIGSLTPNRIGEIPARALLLNKGNVIEITLKTIVASFSQLLITLLFGVLGFCLTFKNFSYISKMDLFSKDHFEIIKDTPMGTKIYRMKKIKGLDILLHSIKELNVKLIIAGKPWNKFDILSYLKLNNIPVPKSSGVASGVDLSRESLMFLYSEWPRDFEKIEQYFPYIRALILREKWFPNDSKKRDKTLLI
jgi:hypothetical protein